MKNKQFHKKAMAVSLCLMLMWAVLGAGTTIAWFTDTTSTIKNAFLVGEMELDVFYKNDRMTDYAPVDSETAVFRDDALYEPGFTQVVYLRIENNGTIDFEYKLSVDRHSYVDSVNIYGGKLHLPAYLRFGVVFAATEPELERKTAQALADQQLLQALALNQYSKLDDAPVPVDGERYAALIVYMPEEVGNEANYRGADVPTVELGLTVFAQQAGAPME